MCDWNRLKTFTLWQVGNCAHSESQSDLIMTAIPCCGLAGIRANHTCLPCQRGAMDHGPQGGCLWGATPCLHSRLVEAVKPS